MRFKPIVLLAAGMLLMAVNSWADLYLDETMDNIRYRQESGGNKNIFGTMFDVATVKVPDDLAPTYIIVVDPGFNRLLWNSFDEDNKTFKLETWQSDFNIPMSIEKSANNTLYITDTGNQRVVKMRYVFSKGKLSLNLLETFGKSGTGQGQFTFPMKIAIQNNPEIIFVSDWKNHNVQLFDANGIYLDSIGKYGNGPGEFVNPSGLKIRNEKLYVCDTGNRRIQEFRKNGDKYEYTKEFDVETLNIPENARITNIEFGAGIFCTDIENNKIYHFDNDFNYVTSYSGDPGHLFTDLKQFDVIPSYVGNYRPYQAIVIEGHKIHAFRLGMGVINTQASPAIFYPPDPTHAETRLKYTLTDNGLVRLKVFDSNDNLVRHVIHQEESRSIGHHEETWDGKDNNGAICPAGTYVFELTAHDINANEGHAVKWVHKYIPVVIHSPPKVTVDSVANEAIYADKDCLITYTLSKSGKVKAEIYNVQNQVIKTLLDGSTALNGQQQLSWTGYNDQGNLVDDGYYQIRIKAQDSEGYWGDEAVVTISMANTPPVLQLNSPSHNIWGQENSINGKITGFELSSYQLSYKAVDQNNWTTIATKELTENIDGHLANWITTELPETESTDYQIQLIANNKAGRAAVSTITARLDNQKPRVVSFTPNPQYISPLAAATGSTINSSSISFEMNELNLDSSYIEIIDQFGTIRKTVAFNTTSDVTVWDGLDEQGNLLKDGQIICRLYARDKGDNQLQVDRQVVIDTNRLPETIAVKSTVNLNIANEVNYKLTWSPDDNELIYAKEEPNPTFSNLWKISSSGNGSAINISQFTTYPPDPWYPIEPDWSPDGKKVLFSWGVVHEMIIATKEIRRFNTGVYPQYSPDGSKIVYFTGKKIMLMNADGSQLKQIATGYYPAWMPDGESIVYATSIYPSGSSLYTVKIDGTEVTGPIIETATMPGVSPDGQMITYQDGQFNIAVLKPDGNVQTLIDIPEECDMTSWSHDGNRIALVTRNTSNTTPQGYVMTLDRPDQYANLTAELMMPQQGTVDIVGSAADRYFDHYELSYANVAQPDQWTRLKDSNNEIKSSALGDWDTSGLSGSYWLKLKVWDKAGNRRQVIKQVNIGLFGTAKIMDFHAEPNTLFVKNGGTGSIEIAYTLKGSTTNRSLKIINQDNQVVKTLALQNDNYVYPTTYRLTWDRKNEQGLYVAEGTYTAILEADDQGFHIQKECQMVFIYTLPTITISHPKQDDYLKGKIEFVGSIEGYGIKSWQVEVGQGEMPTTWTEITSGTIAMSNGYLGEWLATHDGRYTLRVTAQAIVDEPIVEEQQFNIDQTAPVIELDITGTTYQSESSLFVNQKHAIKLNVLEEGSGLEKVNLTVDGNESDAQSSLVLTLPGVHELVYNASDKCLNQSPTYNQTVVVNNIKPMTTLQFLGEQINRDGQTYVNDETRLKLASCEEGETAVPIRTIYWSLSQTASQTLQEKTEYTDVINCGLFGEGGRSFYYYAVDEVDNQESTKIAEFTSDHTPPDCNWHNTGPSPTQDDQGRLHATSATMISFTAKDEGAGLDHVGYQLSGAASSETWNHYQTDEKIVLTHQGPNSVVYYAIDQLGNKTQSKQIDMIIDNRKPVINLYGLEQDQTLTYPCVLEVEISDDYLRASTIKLDGRDYQSGTTVALGWHHLDVMAADWAGNSNSATIDFTVAQATLTPTPTISPSVTPSKTFTTTYTCTQTPTLTPTVISTLTSTVTATPKELPIDRQQVIAYPNPGKDLVNFSFKCDENVLIEIEIFNMNGEKVARIKENIPGSPFGATVPWRCQQMSSGLYLARVIIKSSDSKVLWSQSKKIAIAK